MRKEGKRVVPQVQRESGHRRKQKDLFYLLNKKTIKREREEEKKQEGRVKRGEDLRGGQGGEVSGHEISLVTTETDKRRAHP